MAVNISEYNKAKKVIKPRQSDYVPKGCDTKSPEFREFARHESLHWLRESLLSAGYTFERLVRMKCHELDPDHNYHNRSDRNDESDCFDYSDDSTLENVLKPAVAAVGSEVRESCSPEFATALINLFWHERFERGEFKRACRERADADAISRRSARSVR